MASPLQSFANVRREEVPSVVAAGLFFFCVLTALMVIRPARDALGMQSGIEQVRWLFQGTLLVTLLVNPVFGFLVGRFRRMAFISATYLFFAASLLVFQSILVMAPEAIGERTGQVFYVWFSVFNLFSTALFWALMADRFTLEQSKRFFAVVAVGGTLGAIFGPWLAGVLVESVGTPNLLLVSAGFLVLGLVFAGTVARLQPAPATYPVGASGAVVGATGAVSGASSAPLATDAAGGAAIGGSAWEGFRAVFRSRYLLGISAFALIVAVMATFLYFTRLQMVAELGGDVDEQTAMFARMDFFTQLATLAAQLLVTGHLMKRLGVPFTLALLPITTVLGFVGLAVVGTFAALVVFQAAFNAVQRGIMRPARETLFTIVRREDKYKSKAFIDTAVYRAGDSVTAWLEGGISRLGGLMALASFAVPLAVVWLGLAFWLGRAQERGVEQPRVPEMAPV
jgi:AAA family ATP:ADP antiporter